MQCLDETANIKLRSSAQQSNQLVGSGVANSQIDAKKSGENVALRGDNYNRHDTFRELIFEISKCEDGGSITCDPDVDDKLKKMEFIILYDTQNFDKHNPSTNPVNKDSVIRHFDINSEKTYEIKS